MKYPVILQLSSRHHDDGFYICNDSDELKRASLDAFECLEGRLYEEEPDEDYYPEVTDEYIKNAPTDSIKYDLKELQERREQWLSDKGWNNTYKKALHIYKLYESAKEGNGGSAYHYLLEKEYLKVRYPEEI